MRCITGKQPECQITSLLIDNKVDILPFSQYTKEKTHYGLYRMQHNAVYERPKKPQDKVRQHLNKGLSVDSGILAMCWQYAVFQRHRLQHQPCLFLTLTFTQHHLKDDVDSSVHMCEWLQHKAGGHRGLLSASVSVNITFSSAHPMALLNQFPLSVP